MKPVTNAEPFKGQFPERDVLGSSLLQHMLAATAIAQQLLLAALAICRTSHRKPKLHVPYVSKGFLFFLRKIF